ncbi:hypothetical protein L5515_017247 [Caenorhabditis briggsae]|nr:hypothetical protein L5515_017247 [Caenorhabditis briggsae]
MDQHKRSRWKDGSTQTQKKILRDWNRESSKGASDVVEKQLLLRLRFLQLISSIDLVVVQPRHDVIRWICSTSPT